MRRFIDKHPVISGLILYSLARGLLLEVAEAIKPDITVIYINSEEDKDTPKEN